MATTARRLSPAARREQLAEIAQDLIAADGYASFSLDAVGERAGVTRNLLYHYFPRGRLDLLLAALERGGEQLTGGWVTDSDLPLPDRQAANFARMLEHARGPSAAWAVHRQARAIADPEVQAIHNRYVNRVVESICLNNLGRRRPGKLASAAIRSYVAFAEHMVDQAREQRLPLERVGAVLVSTLDSVVAAIRER
jgi:AcrR family transcriptional regulator